MNAIPGFQRQSILHTDESAITYRAEDANGERFILKHVQLSAPNKHATKQFDRLSRINSPRLCTSVRQFEHDDTPVQVYPDIGGQTLTNQLHADRSLAECIDIAQAIVDALSDLHSAGLVHGRLNPDHVILNAETGALQLIGLSSARSTPVLAYDIEPGVGAPGAYTAPEQTGIIARSIDFRADYYALGATLFQLCTGHPPNPVTPGGTSIEDTLLPPESPGTHRKDLPAPLNDIIMKLLAPYPEDRYLGVEAIRRDLARCREMLLSGDATPFEIALDDVSEHFTLSEKLRERHREIATIHERLPYLHTSASSLVAFAGGIGTGKSSLLRELRRLSIQHGAVVIAGQNESTSVDVPYHAISCAYRDLVGHILTLDDRDALAREVTDELGNDLHVVLELIPQLAAVLVEPPDTPGTSDPINDTASDTKPVLAEALICITRAFCRYRPLVVTLEDMQWADLATLELIERLLQADRVPGLMLACTYRTNEPTERPETKTWLNNFLIRNPGVTVVALRNLAFDSVCDLLCDSVHQSDDEVAGLASIVFEKTAGNPLAIREFVQELLRDQLLTFNHDHLEWQWDNELIRLLPSPTDTSEFLSTRIDKLNEDVLKLLMIAACCGHSFSVELVAEIGHLDLEECLSLLRVAEDLSLIQSSTVSGSNYRFCHDTIRLTFYQRLSADDRRFYHARTGLAILKSQEEHEDIFNVVTQLNNAITVHENPYIRHDELAHLNLAAAQRAIRASAFDTAHRYLWTAIVILGKDGWNNYELALEIHLTAARVAYLCGAPAKVDFILEQARANARNSTDLVAVNEITLLSHISEQRLDEAQTVAMEALDILGVSIPAISNEALGIARLCWRILTMRVNRYRTLPQASDERMLAVMRILNALMQIGYLKGDPQTAGYVTAVLDLSLKHGRFPVTHYALSITGTLAIANLGLISRGYEISHALPDHQDFRGSAIQNMFVEPWKKPLRDTVGAITHSATIAQRNGDLEFAGLASVMSCVHSILIGSDLNLIEANLGKVSQHTSEHRHNSMDAVGRMWQQAIILLQKPGTTPWIITGAVFDETQNEENGQPATLAHLHFAKLLMAVLFEQTTAAEIAADLRPLLRAINGTVLFAQFRFLDSLATCMSIANDDTVSRRERFRLWSHLQTLRRWAAHNPANFEAPKLVIEAEYSAISGKPGQAIQKMALAIEAATTHQRPVELAIAYQRMARLYLSSSNRTELSHFYIQRARAGFLRWGAMSRVSMLDTEFSGLIPDYHQAGEYDVANSPDFNALLKASQYLTGEVVLPNLLRQTMELALEQTGAGRASLILRRDHALTVEITTRPGPHGYTHALIDQQLDVAEDLPVSIIQFVARTREVLNLNNVTEAGSFVRDPYILATQPQSVLCLPILSKTYLTGVIYIENKLTGLSFSQERVSMLQILLSQAAVAIENAKLYEQLNESRDKYLSLFKNSAAGVFELEGNTLTSINPAAAEFLGFDSPEHVINAGLTIDDVVVRREDAEAIGAALNDNRPVVGYEMEVRKPNQDTTWVALSMRRFRDTDDSVRTEGSFIDVAERRRRQQAEQDTRLAQAAALSRSQFLANMSHEIRTPMNAIIGYTELALAEAGDSHQRSHLETIHGASTHLLHIINDILDLSKFESGSIRLQNKPMTMAEVFDPIRALFKLETEQKGLKFVLPNDPSLLSFPLRGDAVRLSQVFINLISNAIKFSESGTITVSMALSYDNDDARLDFIVKDQGQGIREDQLPLIFESFTQGRDDHNGTGLGLAICKRLVNLMNGEISVTSQAPGGSTFSFDVHLQVDKAEKAAGTSPTHTIDLSGLKVLLVEDNQINRELAAITLTRCGLLVDTAEDGLQALARLEAQEYNVVLMDLRMPNMDGFETIRRIRNNPALKDLPVIAISAGVLDGEIEEATANGFDNFIGKPIDYTQLLSALADLTRHTSVKDAAVLDLDDALARHEDNPGFLFDLLRDCVDLYGHADEDLARHVADNDVQAAEHLLHNIASVAGGFGGKGLMEIGRRMERQLREHPEMLAELDVEAFRESLARFTTAVETRLEQHPPTDHPASLAD